MYEKRLPNDLSLALQALEPFKDDLVSTVVESTFNWYWLVDGLIDNGYNVELANPAACAQQYSGLKYSDDKHDAFWLAHMKRLGILPTGYIYPPEQRAIRDMLRRRLQLVGMRSKQLTGIQTQIWRSSGVRIKSSDIKKKTFTIPYLEGLLLQSAQANLTLYRAIEFEIKQLEKTILGILKLAPEFTVLKTITGVGDVLGMTIMLETGTIDPFCKYGKLCFLLSLCKECKNQQQQTKRQREF